MYGLKNAIAIGFVLLAAMGCAGISVDTDYDQDYDFSKLSTYARAHEKPKDGQKNSLISKRVQRFTKEALDEKGYRLVERDQADFLVDYVYSSREVTVPAAIQPSVGVGFGPRRYYGGVGVGVDYYYGGYQQQEIETLIFDIWDAKSKKHIWSAKTETNLVGSNAQKSDENFKKAIQAVFENFPPGAKDD